MRAATCALVAAASLVCGCREVELATEVPEFEWQSESPRRLTFNVGDDRNPQWSPNGDSVYYSAQGYPGLPLAPGVLVAAPAGGGTVRPLYRFLHETTLGPQYHVAPAVSPDGQRILFLNVIAEAPPAECRMGDDLCPGVDPRIQRANLTVRDIDEASTTPPVIIAVDLPGRGSRALPEPYNDHSYPYHELYAVGRIAFTAAWAPDNQRVVFSDGIQLYLWTPGVNAPEPIPGTDHATHPAWSPDGAFIAFMRLRPQSSATSMCGCSSGQEAWGVLRTHHAMGTRSLELVRPDGSEVIVLGPGEDPAWAPDGSLYARRERGIARIDIETGMATPVLGTNDGVEPAVSPDGSRLAFTHMPDAGGSDVWVVDLVSQ